MVVSVRSMGREYIFIFSFFVRIVYAPCIVCPMSIPIIIWSFNILVMYAMSNTIHVIVTLVQIAQNSFRMKDFIVTSTAKSVMIVPSVIARLIVTPL